MPQAFLKKLLALDLEEKILNVGLIAVIAGVMSPWISGRPSIIENVQRTFSGLGYYTSFIGIVALCLAAYTLAITLVPLFGQKPLVRKENRETIRLGTTLVIAVLILAALSVLINITLQSPAMNVRFGIYVSLIGSMVSLLYAFLINQQCRRDAAKAFFHHPEDREIYAESQHGPTLFTAKPPPVPPPPPPPEEHSSRRC